MAAIFRHPWIRGVRTCTHIFFAQRSSHPPSQYLISPARAVTYTATLLHPDDFIDTNGIGASNASQVGYGYMPDFTGGSHALLWTGNANSYVDLHPNTFTSSYASAATDTKQLGYGEGPSTGGNTHALLWSGTAGSVVDLNPAGFDISYGHDVDGTHQVGYGFNTTDFVSHALLWSGTAASNVDLNPSRLHRVVRQRRLRQPASRLRIWLHHRRQSTHALLWSRHRRQQSRS